MLFATDESLRHAQITSAKIPRGMVLSEEEKRREAMEADRELREHQRLREFAWLLFIAPIWASILIWLVQFIAAAVIAHSHAAGPYGAS